MPRATTTRKPRTTRTKKDVETAFDEIVEGAEGQETLDPQAAGLAAEHAASTRSKVSGLSVDTIVKNAATLNLQIGRTLNELTEQCVARANELKTIQDAIVVESSELQRLYDLDIVSASTQLLIEEHRATKESLEKEQETLRATWAEEFATHQKDARQREADLQVARKREEEAYEYNKRIARAQKEDEFARKLSFQDRELADKSEAFEREFAQRKSVLDAAEAELSTLRGRVAGLDAEISTAVTRAEKILTNVLTKDFSHKEALAVADSNAKLQLEQQKVANLEKNNTELARQVIALTTEVKEAHAKVAETAKEALISASGQTALARVMELQQGNGSPNGGSQRSGKA